MFIFQMSKYSRSKQKLILTAVGCMETGNDCSHTLPHTEKTYFTARICVFRLYAVPVAMALEHLSHMCSTLATVFFQHLLQLSLSATDKWIPKYS